MTGENDEVMDDTEEAYAYGLAQGLRDALKIVRKHGVASHDTEREIERTLRDVEGSL